MTNRNPHAFRFRPGMRRGYRSEIPLPTRLVSNEEFPPLPQTPAQRAVEERILADAGRLAPRLGLSRRDFLRRSGGIATSLLAMNAVFGRFFDVLPVEAADPGAFQERTGDPFFIFDVQLHYVGAAYDPGNAEGERKGAVTKQALLGLRRQSRRLNPKLAAEGDDPHPRRDQSSDAIAPHARPRPHHAPARPERSRLHGPAGGHPQGRRVEGLYGSRSQGLRSRMVRRRREDRLPHARAGAQARGAARLPAQGATLGAGGRLQPPARSHQGGPGFPRHRLRGLSRRIAHRARVEPVRRGAMDERLLPDEAEGARPQEYLHGAGVDLRTARHYQSHRLRPSPRPGHRGLR